MYNVLYSSMSRTHTERSDMDHLQITPCLSFVSQAFTRWRHNKLRWKSSDWRLLLIYRPRRDERLSWPGWFTYSGCLTHINGYPSATGRARDREVHRPKDRRYTTVPRNQPNIIPSTSDARSLCILNRILVYYIN